MSWHGVRNGTDGLDGIGTEAMKIGEEAISSDLNWREGTSLWRRT